MNFTDETLWPDSVCRTHVNLRTDRIVSGHPATTVTQQTCWVDNMEAVIRFHVRRLDCEQHVFVYGVLVERTSAHARLNYKVAGSVYGLEAAVRAVIQLTSEPQPQPESEG